MKIKIKDKYILIDDKDYNLFKKFNWSFISGGRLICTRKELPSQYKGKFITVVKKYKKSKYYYKSVLLHWMVVNKNIGSLEVDHINGNTLDNRRSNLRICSHSDNRKNNKIYRNNTSGYPGISWLKRKKTWSSVIRVNNKKLWLGTFKNIIDAISVRKIAEKKYFMNFIRK